MERLKVSIHDFKVFDKYLSLHLTCCYTTAYIFATGTFLTKSSKKSGTRVERAFHPQYRVSTSAAHPFRSKFGTSYLKERGKCNRIMLSVEASAMFNAGLEKEMKMSNLLGNLERKNFKFCTI